MKNSLRAVDDIQDTETKRQRSKIHRSLYTPGGQKIPKRPGSSTVESFQQVVANSKKNYRCNFMMRNCSLAMPQSLIAVKLKFKF